MIPKANEKEGRLIPGMEVIGVSKLTEVVEISRKIEREGELFVWEVSPEKQSECFEAGNHSSVDFSEIKGQTFVKRAAEIAVAGQHNLLMIDRRERERRWRQGGFRLFFLRFRWRNAWRFQKSTVWQGGWTKNIH